MGVARLLFLVIGFGALLAFPLNAPAAAARTALVIGNAAYPDGDADLATPVGDAQILSAALQRQGFSVDTQKNLAKASMHAAMDKFVNNVASGSLAFLYYAGHAVQIGGKNYLIPVDARIWSESDVLRDGMSVDDIQTKMAKRGANAFTLVLDATRRNPFERRFRSISAGLAAIPSTKGILVLFSADPGVVASDDSSRNGLFVSELVKQIEKADQSAEQSFKACREAVSRLTRNQQNPFVSSGLDAPFWFDPNRRAPEPSAPPTPPPQTIATAPSRPLPQDSKPRAPPPATPSPPTPQTDASKRAPAAKAYSPPDASRKAALDARISRDREDEAAIAERGQLYAQHAQYREALVDFDRSVQLNPKNLESRNNACWTRAIVNELEHALTDCNEALKQRPDFVDALDSRGLVYLKKGDNRLAIADYSAALTINPSHQSSLYGRGVARLRVGEVAAGDDDISKALRLDPNIERDFIEYGAD